jgi:hypothetical protein
MSPWLIAIIVYALVAVVTAVPIFVALFGRIELHPGGPNFKEASYFSEEARGRLQQHFDRMKGTLGFWKNQAELYKRLHFYILWWTILSSVIIPFLAQASDDDVYSKWLITMVSAFSAILLTVHRTFKVHENYRAFREGESNFYDTYRRMLDRPNTFGKTEEEQISSYYDNVENLRKFVRNSEIDNTPSIEQVKSQVQNEALDSSSKKKTE